MENDERKEWAVNKDSFGRYIVPVAGHLKQLTCSVGVNCCGDINNGIGFQFDREGCWVVDLETLREIVNLADEKRRNYQEVI